MSHAPLSDLTLRLTRHLWGTDATALPRPKALGLRILRIAYAVVRDLLSGQHNLHAMSLVYTTLLSLIPLLAVSFAVFRAFSVDLDGVESLLAGFLQPLGERGEKLAEQVVDAVEGLDFRLLGSLGVLALFYTVFTLIRKIERAFNYTWHIRDPRKLSQHFEYLSVVVLGPLLILTAFGLTTAAMGTRVVSKLREIETVGALFSLTGQLVPYLLVIATFTFFYLFVPNTRVKLVSALAGALIAGLLWEISSRVFASIVVTSARYEALLSGFAIPLLFMIWLYVSWLVLLVGATVAFYHQHPEFLGIARQEIRVSNRMQEKLGLLLLYLIGRRHYGQGEPWSAEDLAQRLAIPLDVVTSALEALERSRLVAPSNGRETVYIPAKPFEELRLAEVLQAVRTSEEGPYLNAERLSVEPTVDELGDRLAQAVAAELGEKTVKEWVTEGGVAAATAAARPPRP